MDKDKPNKPDVPKIIKLRQRDNEPLSALESLVNMAREEQIDVLAIAGFTKDGAPFTLKIGVDNPLDLQYLVSLLQTEVTALMLMEMLGDEGDDEDK